MNKFTPALFLILLVLLLASGGLAAYFYQQLNKVKENPQILIQNESRELVSRVSQLIVLPEGETPTIATVADPERLKEQPFFANAKRGDKVLIYTNARKAVLYDPVNHKIVEVAPINIGNPQAPSSEGESSNETSDFEEETPTP